MYIQYVNIGPLSGICELHKLSKCANTHTNSQLYAYSSTDAIRIFSSVSFSYCQFSTFYPALYERNTVRTMYQHIHRHQTQSIRYANYIYILCSRMDECSAIVLVLFRKIFYYYYCQYLLLVRSFAVWLTVSVYVFFFRFLFLF